MDDRNQNDWRPDDRRPDNDTDWVGNAKAEVSGMAKGGMDHPSTKPVLTGAAIGAVAGILLPGVSLLVGAAAGAGFAFYNRIKK